MGVTCQILLNKKPEGIHRAGQNVTGIVKYAVDKPTEFKGVILSFLGTGNCSWKQSDTTYYGFEEYITIHIHLHQKKPQETGVLDADITYEYPFEFQLPEDLPSSFKNFTCTIAYRIQLKFEKPEFFSINKTFSTEIPVYGYVEPGNQEGPVIFGLEKTLRKLSSAKKNVINLKAELSKTCLTPGENAHLKLVVTNDTDVLPSVKTELYCYTKYTANDRETTTSITKIKDCCSDSTEIPVRGVANISQTIPTTDGLYSITCKVMTSEYRLRVVVKLPMPRVNAFVEIPVVIGMRKGTKSEDALEGKGESSAGSITPVEERDGPPSYWEVMCEDKESDKK